MTGTCKMKPFILHTAKHPRAFKNMNTPEDAGVYWGSNKWGWMTAALFVDWFDNKFVPDARRHCQDLSLPFRVALVLDNAPGHPKLLVGRNKNVSVVFLPPNVTSFIQPLDQIISSFKLSYHRLLLEHLLAKTGDNLDLEMIAREVPSSQSPSSPTHSSSPFSPGSSTQFSTTGKQQPQSSTQAATLLVVDYWKTFNLRDMVRLCLCSWNNISTTVVRHSWKKLREEETATATTETNLQEQATATAVLARRIPGFGKVTAEDILLMAAGVTEEEEEDLTTEKIMEEVAEHERQEKEIGRDVEEMEEEEETKGGLSLSTLSALLSQLEKLKDDVQELDDDDRRRKAALKHVTALLKMYGDVHTSKLHHQKQQLITRYFDPPRAQVIIRDDDNDDDDSFDATSVVSAVDFEGFAAEVDALMSTDDDPNVPGQSGYEPVTGPSGQ